MPLIEELPLSTPSRAQPGWAYVPEVNAQAAAAAAAAQTASRKRNRGVDTLGSQSAKQQKAIEQRLKDLEKDNYKDVQIAIPKREGADGGAAGGGGAGGAAGATTATNAATIAKSQRESKKTASNARRILGYNRTFAHYLADEEAALQAGQQPYYMQGMSLPTAAANQGNDRDAKRRDSTRVSSLSRAPISQQQQQQQQQQQARKTSGNIKTEQSEDVSMTGVPASPSTTTAKSPAGQAPATGAETATTTAAAPAAYPPQWDNDPLLRTLSLPARPSERVIQKLLAEPPLSWNEARAKPVEAEKQTLLPVPPPPPPPPRHFCIMCGYWGKVKCRKCAERVCGAIQCWRSHEAAGGCGDRPY